MTDTTVDKTDPAKTAPKPGDKAVVTPAKPADEIAAGAHAALHSDSTHPALAAKPTDATPAAPAKTESETLADKLHADLGWAYSAVSSGAKALVADVTGGNTPKDGTTPPKDAAPAPAAAGKDALPGAAVAAPKDGSAAKPIPPGSPPVEAAAAGTPAAKDVPPPPAPPAKPTTSLLGEAANFVGSSVTAASSEMSSLYSDVTGAGKTAATTADTITTDAGSLYSSLSTAASSVATTFTNYFGTGTDAMKNFASTAETVKNLDTMDLDPSKLFNDTNSANAVSKSDAAAAEEVAKAVGGTWMVAGDNKPGGTPTVSAENGHEIGSGKNVDGVPVTTDVTQKSSKATAGDLTSTVSKLEGSMLDSPDFTSTKKGDIDTVYDKKTKETFVFDNKAQTVTVENPKNGTKTTISANEVATLVNPHTEVNQVGDAGQAAAAAAGQPGGANAIQSRFFQDAKGNMALVQSDGMIYKYDKKSNTLEVGKDNHWVEENLTTKKLSYYTEDPKTHVRSEVPPGTLPQGVTVGADGGLAVKGAKVADPSGLLHMGETGSTYNTQSKTLTTDGTGGAVTVQSKPDGSGTVLNGPDKLTVKVAANPAAATPEISVNGSAVPLTHDSKTGAWTITNPDSSNVVVGGDGSIRQETAEHIVGKIDASGNVTATDAQNHALFNISNKGCVGLYDGTQFNPDGEISNADTGFHMMAYVPTSIDASDDNYDPDNSDNSYSNNNDNNNNGYGSDDSDSDGSNDYASQDGSATADGTTPDPNNPNGTDAANGADSQTQIETAALRSGDEDIMNAATFDAFENKVDSTLDKLKAKWSFGQDLAENKDDRLANREDSSEFSKWMNDVKRGDLVQLPKEWKIKGLEQNLDISAFEKGDKDAMSAGAANVGDVASLESFKDNLDALSVRLGIDTSYYESQLNGMEQKIEHKLAVSQSIEEAGLAPTADRIKRMQDGGSNTVIANQFGSDERATA